MADNKDMVKITYGLQDDFKAMAVSLATAIEHYFDFKTGLKKGEGDIFEVSLEGEVIYKVEKGLPDPFQILSLIENKISPNAGCGESCDSGCS